MSERPLLNVSDLVKDYSGGGLVRRKTANRAVDHVSLSIAEGEVLGLIGESGSGKSTTARCILRLVEPTAGEIRFDDIDVMRANRKQLQHLRRRVQMVFQDPYSSLDPRKRVEQIISEGMVIHGIGGSSAARRERVRELLDMVGLRPDHLGRHPAHFSGGERQRIGIARALAVEPQLLVCDEPVASLDLSIQAQILNLFKKLQRELSLTILYIAHDLATVRFLCDRVAVMKDGRILEMADRTTIYTNPQSDYTKELLDAVPVPDPRRSRWGSSGRPAEGGTRKPEHRPASGTAERHAQPARHDQRGMLHAWNQ